MDRLKAHFHKDCGCESSCGSNGGYSSCGAPAGGMVAPQGGEVVPVPPKTGEAPKKMPTTPPMTMNGIGIDATPVAAPRLDNEQEGPKHPF